MTDDRGPVVVEVQTFPMIHQVAEPYGCAKFLARERMCTLVRITTSDGVHGWGECLGDPWLISPWLARFGRELLGQPVHDRTNRLLNVLSHSYHLTLGGPHLYALSGLDIALWDAQARSFGVSVADLLGGRVRAAVTAYGSTGYLTADQDLGRLREDVTRVVEEGLTAVKIRIGTGRDQDRRRAEVARDVLGAERLLMVDYNTNGTWDSARASIDAIRDMDISWYEEPLPPDDRTGWAQLRGLGVTLSGGESLSTRYGFRDAICEHRFDVHQPDLAGCGGLTEGFAIAQMVTAFNSRISPHCWGGAVLAAATLQLLAAVPEAPFGPHGPDPVIFEYDRGENPHRDAITEDPFRLVGGQIVVPDGPGLGIDVDENAVRSAALDHLAIHLTRGSGPLSGADALS